LDEYTLNSLPASSETVLPTLEKLQNLMWEKVGLSRDAEGLQAALAQLEAWETALKAYLPTKHSAQELANLVTFGRLVSYAALLRQESRGAHYRLDFPESREEWQRRIVLTC